MKKSFSFLLTLILLAFTITLLNCGDSSHPATTPGGSSLTNQFAFIQGGGGSAPTYVREVRGVAREKQHWLAPHGAGLQPWANDMDSGPHSVVLMNNDGTGETVIANQAGTFESIQLAADGKAAVFNALATDLNGTYLQIFIAKPSGNTYTITQLTSDAEYHFQPQLSSDGTKIVFVKDIDGNQAYLMSATGGTEDLIPTPAGQNVYSPQLTPDGKSIVYEDCSLDSINFVNLDGSGAAILHNADESTMDDTPAVSPDSKRVAFLSDGNIWVMDITGQNLKQLTTDGMNDDPMFVNNKIVYLSVRDDVGSSEIYSINPDGSGDKRLTNNSFSEWFQTYDENIMY